MSTRIASSEALARKCELVGWPVDRQASGGINVRTPTGRIFKIHRTYSDRNSLKAAERELDKLGLAEALKRVESLEERERQGQLLKDKAANDRRLEAAAKAAKAAQAVVQKASIARAAGGYLTIEQVDLGWFATPHPDMMVKCVILTPKIAEDLLENQNSKNRPLRDSRAEHYRDVIMSGQWRLTHQGLAFDRDGVLQDGQHRLRGIVLAGQAIDAARKEGEDLPDLELPMLVTVGCDPENFKAIDEGMLRTAADLFSRQGEGYSFVIAAAARLLIYAKTEDPRNAQFKRVTNQVVTDFFRDNDPEQIRVSARIASTLRAKVAMPSGPLAAAHYHLSKVNGADNWIVRAFFEGLGTGCYGSSRLMLDDMDARAVLRRQVQRVKDEKKRMRAIDYYALIIAAWNNMVQDRQVRQISMRETDRFPTPAICQFDPKSPANIPRQLRRDISNYLEDEIEHTGIAA